MEKSFCSMVILLLMLILLPYGVFASSGHNGGDNGLSVPSGASMFAEDRVLIKMANTFRTNSVTPNLGVAYSAIRMINPSSRTTNQNTFSAVDMTDTQNNMFVLTLTDTGEDAVQHALNILNANPAVAIAEPDYLYRMCAVPNDPMYDAQYALQIIDAPQAWEITAGDKNVVVGVIDSGIEGTHPDLTPNLWVNPNPGKNGYINDIHGYDFTGGKGGVPTDTDGHGTHVAGIIGAKGHNGNGVTGINWNVSLAWLGVNEGNGLISVSAAIEALNYANNHNISITNNSYGGPDYSALFEEAIANYNGLFVAAAGNDAMNNDTSPHYPASYDCPNIISVASIDESGILSSFSNYGENGVDIVAPGGNILSTYLNGDYRYMYGTSMASPYVAGVAALVKAEKPGYTIAQLKAAVLNGAEYNPALFGYIPKGKTLNAYYALSPRPNAESIMLSDSAPVLDINQSMQLTAEVLPVGANQAVIWTSSDPEIVTVSDGMISGLKTGTSLITAVSMENPDISASVAVTVTSTVSEAILFLDVNFKQMVVNTLKDLYPDDYGSYTVNSSLFPADAEEVLYLHVVDKGIKNTEGLQYFTNLLELNCSNNQLSVLDVSKNTALVSLLCSGNQLTALDVSNNTGLTFLDCGNNLLTALNVRNNTGLTLLDCGNNLLTALDVSKNVALTRLFCYGNQLTELDVRNNTVLTHLNCWKNQLAELDVSRNTELTYLVCDENQLTALDLRKNTALTDLWCKDNQLTALDASQNTDLQTLVCERNQLTELDVHNNMAITFLACSGNPLRLINASIESASITVTANGPGNVALECYEGDFFTGVELDEEAHPPISFINWTQDGKVVSTDFRYELQFGVDYDLTAHFYQFDEVPLIINQPTGQTVTVGETVTFSVEASAGVGTLSYQWHRGDTAIPGATEETYSFVADKVGIYYYYVVVTSTFTDDSGATETASITSDVITLTVESTLDFSGLEAAIATAQATLAGAVIDTDAANVEKDVNFWLQEDVDALFTAIAIAESALAATSQMEIDGAEADINAALSVFENAKRIGEKLYEGLPQKPVAGRIATKNQGRVQYGEPVEGVRIEGAFSPDGGTLSYEWWWSSYDRAETFGYIGTTYGEDTAMPAAGLTEPGMYKIEAKLTNTKDGADSAPVWLSTNVWIVSTPVITSMTAAADRVTAGQPVHLNATATTQDQATMFYLWHRTNLDTGEFKRLGGANGWYDSNVYTDNEVLAPGRYKYELLIFSVRFIFTDVPKEFGSIIGNGYANPSGVSDGSFSYSEDGSFYYGGTWSAVANQFVTVTVVAE